MAGADVIPPPVTKADVQSAAMQAAVSAATAAAQAAVAAMLSNDPPKSEAKVATAGAAPKATRDDHQHPRLTSATTATTDANGQATILFTRTFTAMPSIDLCALEDNANPTPGMKVRRFLKTNNTSTWSEGDTDPVTGCVVYASRTIALPQMTAITGITLVTTLVPVLNTLFAGLSGFLPTAPAGNLKFTIIAVQTSAV